MPCSHGISNPGILKFYNDNVTGAIRPFCFSGLLILVRISHKNPYESRKNLTFVLKTSSYKYKRRSDGNMV